MCSLCPLWLTFLSSFFVFFVRFVVIICFCVLTAAALTHYPRREWLPHTTSPELTAPIWLTVTLPRMFEEVLEEIEIQWLEL